MKMAHRFALTLALLALGATSARGDFNINFENIVLGPDGTTNVFGLYNDPGSNFQVFGDFQARGVGASFALTPDTFQGSGVVSTSLAPFAPGVVTVTNGGDPPFSLVSIDLARENLFNNPGNNGILYPVVEFTGFRVDGTVITQSFNVNQEGFYFNTFAFSAGFTNLLSVAFVQPPFNGAPGSPGLFQFDNIRVSTGAVVPEPASLALCGVAGMIGLGYRQVRRRE